MRLIYEKNAFKSYYVMVVIIFFMFILSGLFFVRITRITGKKKKEECVKEEKLKAKEKRKLEKERKKE